MNYRKTTLTSLFGSVIYERAYYHCRHCHQGHVPTDKQLHVENRKTLAAEELITLAGLLEPFKESAQRVLYKMTGLKTSASTVQRVTERVGETLAQRRSQEEIIGPEENWNWQKDRELRSVAYVSLDATGVRQQGPHAEKVEGRMSQVAAVFIQSAKPAKKKIKLGWRRSGMFPDYFRCRRSVSNVRKITVRLMQSMTSHLHTSPTRQQGEFNHG